MSNPLLSCSWGCKNFPWDKFAPLFSFSFSLFSFPFPSVSSTAFFPTLFLSQFIFSSTSTVFYSMLFFSNTSLLVSFFYSLLFYLHSLYLFSTSSIPSRWDLFLSFFLSSFSPTLFSFPLSALLLLHPRLPLLLLYSLPFHYFYFTFFPSTSTFLLLLLSSLLLLPFSSLAHGSERISLRRSLHLPFLYFSSLFFIFLLFF